MNAIIIIKSIIELLLLHYKSLSGKIELWVSLYCSISDECKICYENSAAPKFLIVIKDKNRADLYRLSPSIFPIRLKFCRLLVWNFEFRESYSDFRESSPKFLKIIENRFFIIIFDRVEIFDWNFNRRCMGPRLIFGISFMTVPTVVTR